MKRYTLYLLLGVVTGMFIVSGIFNWLGIPTLGQWLTGLSGGTYVVTMLGLGVVILIITIWLIKMAKEMKKENRPSS
jgi:uncharacterized membrane protein